MTQTKNKALNILVTNDDGVDAKGIRILADVAKNFGNVVLLGPNAGRSGMSHAITFSQPLRLQRIHAEKGLLIYKTNGTPSDAVKVAQSHIFKNDKIDLLLSGINHGSNTSSSTIYSGTVAAAVEGCLSGVPSVAFSLCDYDATSNFELSKMVANKLIAAVLKNGLPPHVCLNVNIPNVSIEEFKGIKVTRQAQNYWKETLEERIDPVGRSYFWLDGSMVEVDNKRDTDQWAINHKYASLTPVTIDLTAHQSIALLKKWSLK